MCIVSVTGQKTTQRYELWFVILTLKAKITPTSTTRNINATQTHKDGIAGLAATGKMRLWSLRPRGYLESCFLNTGRTLVKIGQFVPVCVNSTCGNPTCHWFCNRFTQIMTQEFDAWKKSEPELALLSVWADIPELFVVQWHFTEHNVQKNAIQIRVLVQVERIFNLLYL